MTTRSGTALLDKIEQVQAGQHVAQLVVPVEDVWAKTVDVAARILAARMERAGVLTQCDLNESVHWARELLAKIASN